MYNASFLTYILNRQRQVHKLIFSLISFTLHWGGRRKSGDEKRQFRCTDTGVFHLRDNKVRPYFELLRASNFQIFQNPLLDQAQSIIQTSIARLTFLNNFLLPNTCTSLFSNFLQFFICFLFGFFFQNRRRHVIIFE